MTDLEPQSSRREEHRMAFGARDTNKNTAKDKGKTEKGGKATTPRDLPILTPARPPRREGQGRG
jgi:hypothetical protein